MHSRHVIRAALAAPLAALVLVAAACGGGGGSPGVAALAGSNTTSTDSSSSSSPPAPGSSDSGNPSGQGEMAMKVGADGAKFAACMRKNGVPNFPDPNGQGVITIGSGSGIDPRSPKFQAASQTCRKLLPNGGQPTPQQIAKMKQAALAFSACMRAHGVKDFPDPTFSGGGVQMSIHAGSGSSDLNPNSPVFQKAKQACGNLLPGRPKLGATGGGNSSGGK
jgi:hypothetical protein